jgi:hypothetical protein
MTSPDPADAGVLVQDIVYAGLEALKAAITLDLCAYLHASEEQGPQLFLGCPDLASIDAAEAFALFSALRDALEDPHDGDETMLLGGFLAVAVSSRGEFSRGLHVVGRREVPFEDSERETIKKLTTSIASIVHALEQPGVVPVKQTAIAGEPIRVAVEMLQDRARAEVAAPFGDEIRAGTAEAQTPARAVVLAVIDAVDASLKLRDTAEGDIGGERAVLVLLSDERDRLALGSALIDSVTSDALRASASAALDAAQRLTND